MGAPKPIAGYPSRTAAIMALREQGVSNGGIARQLGLPVNTVSSLIHERNRAAAVTVLPRPSVSLHLPYETRRLLRPHAARRGLNTLTLALLILDRVVDDNLVDAVLDDGRR